MAEKRDVVVGVAQSLKAGQGILRALTTHLQDVAVLVKEVVELRERCTHLEAATAGAQIRAAVLQKRYNDVVGTTDAMGFGKRMAR